MPDTHRPVGPEDGHLTGVTVAVLAAALFFTAPAFADHRSGNVVVMGGTLLLTGRLRSARPPPLLFINQGWTLVSAAGLIA